jgi:hypothetical protein
VSAPPYPVACWLHSWYDRGTQGQSFHLGVGMIKKVAKYRIINRIERPVTQQYLLLCHRPGGTCMAHTVIGGGHARVAAGIGVNSILNMKVFLLAAAGSGNLANEHSLDLLIS